MENSSATLAASAQSTTAANSEDATSVRTMGSPAGSEKCWYDETGTYIHSGEWTKPPAGATFQTEEMVWGWDGAIYRKDDPRRFGSTKRQWRAQVDSAIADILSRLSALESQVPAPPEAGEGRQGVSVQAPPPDSLGAEVPSPPEQADDEIPPLLQRYAEADETAEEFRLRLNRMLFRFGIKEGEHFLGGGEALSIDEKIRLLPMLVANFKAGNWLKLDEELEPKD